MAETTRETGSYYFCWTCCESTSLVTQWKWDPRTEKTHWSRNWSRTGVLTFDGNVKLKEKVTYEGIRQHLQNVYHWHFSYGTIVELCVARNKRRRSAQRYHGIAKVTTRRARKGFNLRFNPDKHWSAAFYKGLNKLQYAAGRDMVNVMLNYCVSARWSPLCQYSTLTFLSHQSPFGYKAQSSVSSMLSVILSDLVS